MNPKIKIAAIFAVLLVLLALAPSALAVKDEEQQIEQAITDALSKESGNMELGSRAIQNSDSPKSSAAILLNKELVNINGVEYKKETYEMEVGSGDYDKISYIIFRRSDVGPTIVNVFLAPGDSMLGEYAFAYPFSESLVKKIIDGTITNKNLKFINLISRLTNGKVAVVVVDKVRAAYVPTGLSDYSFTSGWNLEAYEGDFRKIVADANARTGTRIYMTAGHSREGEMVQLHGEHPLGILLATIPLDIIGEYKPGSQGYKNSIATLKALDDYMAEGNYVADVSGLFDVLDLAQYYPDDLSPVPGFEGMTNMQAALYMLENTGSLPGPLTPVTGLADSWYIKAYCVGDLEKGLYYTDINKLFEIRNAGGFYPIIPLALEKQSMEKRTHGGIDESGLKVDFEHWKGLYISINAEDGFELDSYTKRLMHHGIFKEIPGGHLDLLEQIK